jgi:hypothetical protein
MKRIVLFGAVNIAVFAVVTAIVELLGLDRYLAARGLSRFKAFGIRDGAMRGLVSALFMSPSAHRATDCGTGSAGCRELSR